MKILYQGSPGAYSHLAALEVYPDAEIIACKTFDECFARAQQDDKLKIIIPESNKTTGNIGIEYLIFKYRLNIYAEHFHKIEHNLLGLKGAKISNIKNVLSHAQGLSQCSNFIKKNNFNENIRADTAGSAELIAKNKIISDAAIASKLSAKIYKLDVLASNIENEKGNTTRFLIMGKSVLQPDFEKKNILLLFCLN
jgi:prephenate dehydratase